MRNRSQISRRWRSTLIGVTDRGSTSCFVINRVRIRRWKKDGAVGVTARRREVRLTFSRALPFDRQPSRGEPVELSFLFVPSRFSRDIIALLLPGCSGIVEAVLQEKLRTNETSHRSSSFLAFIDVRRKVRTSHARPLPGTYTLRLSPLPLPQVHEARER